eukprot:302939_1
MELHSPHSRHSQKLKVLLLESIHENASREFEKAGFLVENVKSIPPEELADRLKNVDILGVYTNTKLTAEVLRAAKHLVAIGAFCVGTDQINRKEAAALGIPVFNDPFDNSRSVAELILAEMFMLARHVGDRNTEMHNGIWKKACHDCYEVRHRTLGLVGYGTIGQQVSVLAEAVGMEVQFYDVIPKSTMGCAKFEHSLDKLLSTSDFVVVLVPLIPQTIGMIGEDEIAMMKKGSYLVNAARGKVVDVEAVASALKSGDLAGCAEDVFPVEPKDNTDHFETPLQGCENVVLTPHIAGTTVEAQTAIAYSVARKLIKFARRGVSVGAVNFPQCTLYSQHIDFPIGHQRVSVLFRMSEDAIANITSVLGEFCILSQAHSARNDLGYIIVDTEIPLTKEAVYKIKSLEECVRLRILSLSVFSDN